MSETFVRALITKNLHSSVAPPVQRAIRRAGLIRVPERALGRKNALAFARGFLIS
jgi:hypothetical protein